MSAIVVLATIALLIAINALFALAEFSSVSARRTRLATLAQDGSRSAAFLLRTVDDPARRNAYIAACQVGITLSGLVLGFYGQGATVEPVARLLARSGVVDRAAALSLAAGIVLVLLTGLQMVLAELVPKNVVVRQPERIALLTVGPVRVASFLLAPVVRLLTGTVHLILRAVGQSPVAEGLHVHRADEIRMLVAESGAGGAIDRDELRLLENTLRWREQTARQSMVPRTHLLASSVGAPRREMLATLAGSSHSRLLLFESSIDDIVGFVHLKDLLCAADEGWNARATLRPVRYVPEAAPMADVFAALQRGHQPIAIVLDEYGGTAGMVAVDDVLEAIFGELRDEFDTDHPPIQALSPDRLLVRGDTRIDVLNERLGLYLASQEADSVGGLVLGVLGRLPEEGEEVDVQGIRMRVERMSGNAVAAVSLPATPGQLGSLQERAP